MSTDTDKKKQRDHLYYLKNKEKIKEKRRADYQNNPEVAKERARQWREAHYDQYLEGSRKYCRNHSQWKKESDKKYREDHLEEKRAKDRAYTKNHQKEATDRLRRWRRDNPEKQKAKSIREKAARHDRHPAGYASGTQIAARVAFFGGVCAYCRGLYEHLDHVIPLARGGSQWPANLRPACAACNLSKGTSVWSQVLL